MLRRYENEYPAIITMQLVTQIVSALTGLATATIFSLSISSMLTATNSLIVTAQGMITVAEGTLLDVIDNCKESVAVLSLADLTFLRGNQSTSLCFGDFYMGAKIIDFVFEEDQHILLGCISQLLESMENGDSVAGDSRSTTSGDDGRRGTSQALRSEFDEESPLLPSPTASTEPSKPKTVAIEYRVYDSNRDLIWLESTVLLHKEAGSDHNEVTTIMLLTRDITVKKSEMDILRRENAAKLQYITCCAHDLKTPLQSFSSALDLLLASGLTADQRDIWNQAEVSLSLMNLTIAQTMDTSKVLMVCGAPNGWAACHPVIVVSSCFTVPHCDICVFLCVLRCVLGF
jgi:hypothetical protein